MYCSITPTVGLIPVVPTSGTQANSAGFTTTKDDPRTADAPVSRLGRPYNLSSGFGYPQNYRACMNFPPTTDLASAETQYRWGPAYFAHCLSQQMQYGAMEGEGLKYAMDNGGISLKAYMMMQMESNKQHFMTSPLNQYRDPKNSSTDESLSPTSSSSVLSSSKDSSPYSSSSGRSSESGYDTHGTDNPQQYNAKQWAEQRIRQAQSIHKSAAREENRREVEVFDEVRPRIRPEKQPRQVARSKGTTRQARAHPQRQDVHRSTPECGLVSHKNSTLHHVPKVPPTNHPTGGPIYANYAAMDVDNVTRSGHQTGHKFCERKPPLPCSAGRERRDAASPVKQRIQKFENLCESIAKAAYEKTLAETQGSREPTPIGSGNREKCVTAKARKSPGKKSIRNVGDKADKPADSASSKMEEAKRHFGSSKKMFLGMYEVLAVLGVGGGGTVYSGTRISDSKPIAIKRIMREKVKRWEKIQGRRVPQEIVLMLKVNGHKNVIRLLDWYECLDSFILILERPHNCIDLFDYIREVGKIPEHEGSRIFRQVVEAVIHIHSRGVLHRDIKDENVVINRDTKVPKIIDFGCGTGLYDGFYKDFSGTPEFYPPEWFIKHHYEGRSATTWSLGVLLYDMLCGEIPFKTKSKIMANVLNFKVAISPKAKHLIMWLLCSDPDARPDLSDILRHPWMQQ